MASIPSPTAAEVQEVLLSPHFKHAPLIADDNVASGSYRRPSLPSPSHSFRNVTACSPLSSPDDEQKAAREADNASAATSERGGRRRMVRSGTSESVTPLPASSPSDSTINSDRGSTTAASSNIVSPAVTTPGSDNKIDLHNRPTSASSMAVSVQKSATSSSDMQPALTAQRTNSNRLRPHDVSTAATRSDGLLSVPSTPATDDPFRSPSQFSVASDADGYFTARPGSPIESNDIMPLSMLRFPSAKAHSVLRRERVSWSGRSYVSCTSDYEADLAAGTSKALSIDDEACYVDGEHTLPTLNRTKGKATDRTNGSSRRVDFLSRLPPELSLCIVFMLQEHTDLLRASLVSKRWRALALDQSVWRHLFFSHPGWAIREDAPLVVQHQAELQRVEAKARRTAAKEEADRLRRLQAQRKAASTSSPYLDRLAALKSWRETLHIPSFPQLAALSLTNPAAHTEVDVDTGRPVGPPMSPLRSPTAATGRFGLFLSPARGAPSTPAGARRAQEAAAGSSYFASYDASNVPLSRQGSVGSMSMSRRTSADSLHFAEVVEAEEFFAATLDWTRLYRDRYTLEQRWMRGHLARKVDTVDASAAQQNDAGGMARTASVSSTNSELTAPPAPGASDSSRAIRDKRRFEPRKRFLRGHQDSVYCIRQDDGVGTGTAGKLVSGSRDRTIRVWDVETGACKHILKGHTASVLSLQYDDQILVSVSSDGQVFVWDFASVLATPKASTPTTETPTSTGRANVDPECSALVHEKADRVQCVLRDHTSAVLDVVFDANWIVTGSKDATVRVWRRSDVTSSSSSSISSAPVAWRKFTHTGPVNAVDLQGDQVVSASGEGSMYLWNLQSGEKVHTFNGHTKGLACIVLKGNTLVSGSNDQTIRVWDTSSGECTHVLGEHQMLVRTIAFDPTRRLVVSGGYDRLIKLWHLDDSRNATCHGSQEQQDAEAETQAQIEGSDIEQALQQQQNASEEVEDKPITGKCLRDIRCHRARIFDVDFNTTRIVSASEDHLICITHFGGQGVDTSLFA